MRKLLSIVFVLALSLTTQAQQNLALDGSVSIGASSTINANFPASAAFDGDRSGYGWGAGGGWNDATRAVFPDSLSASFPRPYSFGRVVVYTLQDNFSSSVEPTATQTCALYGVKDFDVEVLNLSGVWVGVASVTGNNLCRREVAFTPTRGTALRIVIHASGDGLYSRIIELAAFSN